MSPWKLQVIHWENMSNKQGQEESFSGMLRRLTGRSVCPSVRLSVCISRTAQKCRWRWATLLGEVYSSFAVFGQCHIDSSPAMEGLFVTPCAHGLWDPPSPLSCRCVPQSTRFLSRRRIRGTAAPLHHTPTSLWTLHLTFRLYLIPAAWLLLYICIQTKRSRGSSGLEGLRSRHNLLRVQIFDTWWKQRNV
jgi:hypothetical protein